MEIIKTILLIIGAIVSFMLVVLMLMQTDKSDGNIITGSSSDGYLDNNKDRSTEAVLRRMTIVSGVCFMIIAFTLGLLYIVPKEETQVIDDSQVQEVQEAQPQEGEQVEQITDVETEQTAQ